MKESNRSKKEKIVDQLLEGDGFSCQESFDNMIEKIAKLHDVPKNVVRKIISDWSANQGRLKTKK